CSVSLLPSWPHMGIPGAVCKNSTKSLGDSLRLGLKPLLERFYLRDHLRVMMVLVLAELAPAEPFLVGLQFVPFARDLQLPQRMADEFPGLGLGFPELEAMRLGLEQ